MWVKDAPEFGVDNNDDVCDFVDQYVSCKLPNENDKLKDLQEKQNLPFQFP